MLQGSVPSSGNEILELLVHDALVKGVIVLVGLAVLVIGLVTVWKLVSRRLGSGQTTPTACTRHAEGRVHGVGVTICDGSC